MKTSGSTLPALRARIEELHSYEVPEFLVVPIEGGSKAYLDWVLGETGGEG
jgi:periplasmic divalent cation tolerance protein